MKKDHSVEWSFGEGGEPKAGAIGYLGLRFLVGADDGDPVVFVGGGDVSGVVRLRDWWDGVLNFSVAGVEPLDGAGDFSFGEGESAGAAVGEG